MSNVKHTTPNEENFLRSLEDIIGAPLNVSQELAVLGLLQTLKDDHKEDLLKAMDKIIALKDQVFALQEEVSKLRGVAGVQQKTSLVKRKAWAEDAGVPNPFTDEELKQRIIDAGFSVEDFDEDTPEKTNTIPICPETGEACTYRRSCSGNCI